MAPYKLAALFENAQRWLHSSLVRHFVIFRGQIDPIQAVLPGSIQSTVKEKNVHFAFAIAILLLTGVYGTVGLHYEATGSIDISWTTLRDSPYIFTHQVCPYSVRSQIDFGLWSDILGAVGIYLALIFTRAVNGKEKIYQLGDSIIFGTKEINGDESEQILKFRNKTKPVLEGFTLLMLFALNTFFLGNVWWNSVYSLTVGSLLYWSILFPLFIFYIVYGVLSSIIYIILASGYLSIRQKSLLKRFGQLNTNLAKVKRHSASGVLPLCWRQFALLNRDAIHLCVLIREQARFCTPVLSVIFPYYISVQCYLIYIVFYIRIPFVQMLIFYFTIMELNLFLFLITHECAITAKCSRRLEVMNRVFCFEFSYKGGPECLNYARQIKTDTMQAYRRFHSCSFKLLGNYRITSKTYYVIISYIGAYFLFVFKKL